MQAYLLSLLLIIPLAGALVTLAMPSTFRQFRTIALVASLLQLIILLLVFTHYSKQQNGLQLIELKPWITLDMGTWGILKANYFLAVDGLSLPLVALSVIVVLIAVISSWKIEKSPKGYFALLLILNAAVIGTFCAQDFLLFYLFFEFMLLPMFFLIGIWGGIKREYASIKFFLYTLLGSIFILIVMIALYLSTQSIGDGQLIVHSFSLVDMQEMNNIISNSILDPQRNVSILGMSARTWAFILLFVGFGIKLPMIPLHTWLPDAHVEAPTPISVLLAALLLKIGGYGLLRITYPIFPDIALELSWLVALFGVVSIIYGGLAAMASKDLKRLIAYSSISHMGFVLLGIASVTPEGSAGAIYQMVSHGIISAMLFLLVGVLYDRTHDRMIGNYSGLSTKMPVYFTFTLIAFFASLGLPGLSGFMAELMVFLGAFKSGSTNYLLHESFAIVATLGLVLGAVYYLWTLQRMFFGKFHVKPGINSDLADVDLREKIMLIPLLFITVALGIFPQVLLNFINPFAEAFSTSIIESGKMVKALLQP
jgi:NADH-quinone oxidoreductase subunit M